MIKELRSTEIDHDCAGTQADLSPCPNVDTYNYNVLILGSSMTNGFYHDCGSGNGIQIWPKAASKSIVIANPGSVTASTTAAEIANVINVTLKHDGTNVTGTIAEVVAAINSTATVKDSLAALSMGDSSVVCATLASTALAYLGTGFNKNLIRIPVCPNCGTLASVSRTWDSLPMGAWGSLSDKHRRVTNYLGKQLKLAGRVNPFALASVTAEMSDPPNMPNTPTFPATTPPFVVF